MLQLNILRKFHLSLDAVILFSCFRNFDTFNFWTINMTTHINAAAAAAAVLMEEFKSNELKFKKHNCAEKCRVIITRLILIIVN